jgi:hypothetical protein
MNWIGPRIQSIKSNNTTGRGQVARDVCECRHGRTGEIQVIKAGLSQGSPVSPMLFNIYVSAVTLFQLVKDRHPKLQVVSSVDDIGLVVEYGKLGEDTRQLERISRDAVRWGSENKVEFEVNKTEALVFSRRREVLQAANNASISIGEQTFTINKDASKWLGFWLDFKLSARRTPRTEW